MKRSFIAGLGTIAAMAAISFVGDMPVLANLQQAGTKLVENIQRQPQVQLLLAAEKRIVQRDQQGKEKVTWQALKGQTVVQPGDTLRYTVSGKNSSDRPVKDFVVTQPIPKQTKYVLNSVTVQKNGTKATYSIDNGKSFVEKPTIQVKLPDGKVETRPAPAERYTHVRWNFAEAIGPTAAVRATYQVQVR